MELNLFADPIGTKEKMQNILSENGENIEGHLVKIDILKLNIRILFLTGDFENIKNKIDETIKYIQNDLLIDNSEKEKFLNEFFEELFGVFIENGYLVFGENGEIYDEKVKFFEGLFEFLVSKNKDLLGMGLYYFGLFYGTIGDNEKSFESFENSALLGYEKGIEDYTSLIKSVFLDTYKSFSSKEEKENFLKNELENSEEVFFQFIDDYQRDENGKREKTVYGGNKYLYEKIGDIYAEIGMLGDALSCYSDLLQTGNYEAYKKIAEIYEKNRNKFNFLENIDSVIEKNYNFLVNRAYLVKDLENIIYGLEKLGDLKKDNGFYFNAIQKIIKFNSDEKFSKKSLVRLMEKIGIETINIKNGDFIQNLDLDTLYSDIANNFDDRYILSLANFYEKKGEILYAFLNYFQGFESGIDGVKDGFLIFIKTTLKDFIEKSRVKNIESFSENEELIKIANDEFFIKKELLQRIIKNIENGKQTREDFATLFDMALGDEFYEDLNYEKISYFFEGYTNKIPGFNIFLHRILINYFEISGVNLKDFEIKNLLGKIYRFEELNAGDLKNLKLIINFGEEKNIDNYDFKNF
ncbi:hypothetical protein LR002_00505 [Candidatus Gracilibacteria bacterium]|nr:hypothetical protein [Candidatus Gracilibacteria bacterium]